MTPRSLSSALKGEDRVGASPRLERSGLLQVFGFEQHRTSGHARKRRAGQMGVRCTKARTASYAASTSAGPTVTSGTHCSVMTRFLLWLGTTRRDSGACSLTVYRNRRRSSIRRERSRILRNVPRLPVQRGPPGLHGDGTMCGHQAGPDDPGQILPPVVYWWHLYHSAQGEEAGLHSREGQTADPPQLVIIIHLSYRSPILQ